MISRRSFCRAVSASVFAAPLAAAVPERSQAGSEVPRPFNAGLALQLYSLRHRFARGDVDGALALTRSFGFRHVEGNPPKGMAAGEFASKLQAHGLAAMGTGVEFEALSGTLGKEIDEAHALSAQSVMCAWIPHGQVFLPGDAEKAVAVFDKAARAFKDAGLTFLYHTHGYEFQPGPDGTLFDTIAKHTDPSLVQFEMDVFWVVRGGGDPVRLFETYPTRFFSTHVKDMRKGTAVGDPTGSAPEETNVPVGQGAIDWPAVFRAARHAGVKWHIIEDESPDAETQIPQSLKYIASLKG
jgi:sugar phosphate isomerase/epimerase